MRVLKFGGSSVATPERIRIVVDILKRYYGRGDRFTVVFSAFGGATNQLLEMAHRAGQRDESYKYLFEQFFQRHEEAVYKLIPSVNQPGAFAFLRQNHDQLHDVLHGIYLLREVSKRSLDYIQSFGERNSAYILQNVLNCNGVASSYLDARLVIRTDDQFGCAKVDFTTTNALIQTHYRQHPEMQVVTGFIGASPDGATTTLGRGGSDYTASIIAAALQAEAIEIWTDVNGVLTADPRKVKKAFTIPSMTYAEAMEMSHFGAKVIYPPTLQPVLKHHILVFIRNTLEPSFTGTEIFTKKEQDGRPITGISSIGNVALLTLQGGGMFGIPGTAARLFSSLSEAGISVILITQGSSEHSITFAVAPELANMAKKQVDNAFVYEIEKGIVEEVKVEKDLAVVAIIGENMRYRPGISGRMFQALGKNGINVIAIAQGSSELNISVVVDRRDEAKAMNALHEAFFLSDTKALHLFMVGVGLIGTTLLQQIKDQEQFLREKRGIEIKIMALANSKNMFFSEEGMDLTNWKATLQSSSEALDLPAFVQHIISLNLPNTIFVDNTANDRVVQLYDAILENSIAISTPNKLATSSSFLQYQRLKQIAAKRGVPFGYETTVGAGLPVISTLNDLLLSGDRILKIEAVLSGSMSFIFNNLDGQKPFSVIVKEAMEKGFTEPDPREDLSGSDVRRKLLILARESGLPLGREEVEMEPFLPPAVFSAPGIAAFFETLIESDEAMEAMRKKAAQEGKVLRMIATLASGKASVGVKSIDPSHPFFSLSGSDNMIVFTTDRYKERPLVIRGPGAGAEVTAAGVFAEIIKIGNPLLSKE